MLTTVSGTGVILLAFGLVVWLFKRCGQEAYHLPPAVRPRRRRDSGDTRGLTLQYTRVSGERSAETSSSNARFVEPYERVYDDLEPIRCNISSWAAGRDSRNVLQTTPSFGRTSRSYIRSCPG